MFVSSYAYCCFISYIHVIFCGVAIPPHLCCWCIFSSVSRSVGLCQRCWGSHALYGEHMSPSWRQMLSPISRYKKEIMSQGPQVLDMEYREQDWPEHGPGGPILLLLHQNCPVSSSSIHHHRLGLASEKTLAPWGNWSRYHGMCHVWSL